jgi:hypothetical protein
VTGAIRLLAGLAVLFTLVGCAEGPGLAGPSPGLGAVDTVQAPAWRVGSEWEYSDGYGLRVTASDGSLTRFQRLDAPEQWVARRGFLRESSQSATTARRLLFEDLPPGTGTVLSTSTPLTYRREYDAGGVTRVHATSWTVERRERVRVPAGEFDCFVLVMRTRSLNDDWSGYERWWFSPEVQNYVRLEYRYGPDEAGSRVLMRYALARG